MKTRVCSVCKKEFPLTKEFWHKACKKNGYFRHTCRECDNIRHAQYRENNKEKTKIVTRRYHLKIKFGITLEKYESMVLEQEGKCFICNEKETSTRSGKVKRLAVDHCHKTDKVRQLLCQRCNTVLGKVKEDTDLLERMMHYIEMHTIEELR
jgi:hypothetical protein